MSFTFKCTSCEEIHEGMPNFDAHAPLSYYAVPENERAERCVLGSDDCVIDKKYFFVLGCIEIPVKGAVESFSWGVWVSLSETNYMEWAKYFDETERSHIGPLFGWLDAWLKPYPDTMNLKTRIHLRDDGVRPFIELEPTIHPLAVEQRSGISEARVAELYSLMMHQHDG
ncbi:DUF2199 domain-containing protein [Collimonas arenae]|uniref:DUF2199 domain-containing protein n=1 Tax=Collimonas arenae TaxID=279058 RepID=UPI00056DD692|nr:DUF2199 domain-containing protein [Collimonas arenae]